MASQEKQIVPMKCPVCGITKFVKLYNEEIEMGISPNDCQCDICGWYYDLEQTKNPNLKNQANKKSLNEYIKWYQEKISENPKWRYIDTFKPKRVKHPCPVCGKYIFKSTISYDICPICGWEDNGFEDYPHDIPYEGGKSFYQTKKEYFKKLGKNIKK